MIFARMNKTYKGPKLKGVRQLIAVDVLWVQNERGDGVLLHLLGIDASPYETSTVSLSVCLFVRDKSSHTSHHQISLIFASSQPSIYLNQTHTSGAFPPCRFHSFQGRIDRQPVYILPILWREVKSDEARFKKIFPKYVAFWSPKQGFLAIFSRLLHYAIFAYCRQEYYLSDLSGSNLQKILVHIGLV